MQPRWYLNALAANYKLTSQGSYNGKWGLIGGGYSKWTFTFGKNTGWTKEDGIGWSWLIQKAVAGLVSASWQMQITSTYDPSHYPLHVTLTLTNHQQNGQNVVVTDSRTIKVSPYTYDVSIGDNFTNIRQLTLNMSATSSVGGWNSSASAGSILGLVGT